MVKYQKHFWTFLVLIGLIFFSLLFYWNSFNTPFERDEGEYAYSAWILSQGKVPYLDSFLQKPPLIIYTYLLGYLINPSGVWPARLLAFLFTLATALLIYLITQKEFGQRAGWLAAFLYIPMINFPYLSALAANTEKFMLLPLVGLLSLFVFYRKSPGFWPWLLAGVLAILAIFYKQIALLPVLFILFIWLKSQPHSWLRRLLYIVLGILLTSSLVLGYFLVRGAGGALLEDTVFFNGSLAINEYGLGLNNFLNHLTIFLTNWWVLFILLGYFVFQRPNRWWFYISLVTISLLTVFLSPIGHYYLLLMPFWAIISGVSLDLLSKRFSFLVIFPVLFLMLWPIKQQFTMTPEQINLWIYGTANPFIEAPLVAEKLANLTSPEDFVFVAGTEPEILYLAKRQSSTLFVNTYALNIDTPRRLDYQKIVISDLKSRPPQAIVFSRRAFSGIWNEGSPTLFIDYLLNLINKDYHLIGGYVWENGFGHWQQPLAEKDINNASLIIYERNTR